MARITAKFQYVFYAFIITFFLSFCDQAAQESDNKTDDQEQKESDEPAKSDEPQEASANIRLPISDEDMVQEVTSYIESARGFSGGFFMVKDFVGQSKLQLKLRSVHDKMHYVGSDTYFICVDFEGTDNKLYDVDIFMRGRNKDELEATEIRVHKVDNVSRYTWYEENGIWKMRTKP